jgi:hypothetical protein
MPQTVTLQLPDDMLQRCQRGATAARKRLEEFLVDRLMESLPPFADEVPSPLRKELSALEQLDDEALWQMAQGQLSLARQRLYSRLLTKNSQGTITAQEKNTLQALGDEARLLTLKKAHAALVLRWRGHRVPTSEALQKPA